MSDAIAKPKRAYGRSLSDFENLSWAEKKLIVCVARGKKCVLGDKVPDAPTRANAIRPDLIRFLALGGDEVAPVHEKGVQLQGAYIGAARQGDAPCTLSFESATLTTSLWLLLCRFDAPVVLQGAEGRSIALDGSAFPGVMGDSLKLKESLSLHRVRSIGEASLLGARIGGDLVCEGGSFENIRGNALSCDGAEIGGVVAFCNRFHATGAVRLLGLKLRGILVCTNARFENDNGIALSCDHAEIGAMVFLNENFHSTGAVTLIGTKIDAGLNCIGGRFENIGGNALYCDGAQIGGPVYLQCGFHANGEVRFVGATIGGPFECDGGIFQNPQRVALQLDHAAISGPAFLRGGFFASGTVRLLSAEIGGDLSCINGRFDNVGGISLYCDGAKIGGALFFCRGAQATGTVSLAQAKVGTLVDDLLSWPRNSLVLDGFRYERIAVSASLDAKQRIEWLDLQEARYLSGKAFALQPWMQLAKVLREQGHFRDAAEVDIAREDRLRAAGKVADRTALKKCLRAWGKLGPDGCYTSFFSILARLDDFVAWASHWFYGRFSGYGHRPMRIVYSALFMWLTFAAVYYFAASDGHFAPTSPATANAMKSPCQNQFGQGTINWTRCEALLTTYPRFSPLAYSLDLILPVARLGQSNMWTPISDGSWFSLARFLLKAAHSQQRQRSLRIGLA